jgi:hypothetical protein
MVSQLAGYPVEKLKSDWLSVSTNFYLSTESLYLRLLISINWPISKPSNWPTK